MAGSTVQQPPAEVRRGRGCCGWGCLLMLGTLVLVVAIGGLTYFRVPEQAGLFKPPAERLLSGTADREGAAAITEEMRRAGIDTKGVEVHVLPIAGTDESVVFAVIDSSQGFKFPSRQGVDPLTNFMAQLANSPTAKQRGISRVALDYRGSDGASVMTITAPSEAVSAYASGRITKREFMRQVHSQFGLEGLVQTQLGQ